MNFTSIDPSTGQAFATHPALDDAGVEHALARAGAAAASWAATPLARRTEVLRRAGAVLREERRDHAARIVREMGKPIRQALAEIDKCAATCEWYADNAERILAPQLVASDAVRSFVRFDPLGAVLAVMPWNFPYFQVVRFAAPALAAGNVALLKHAPNVPGCALAIEELLFRAGVPDGVFQSLLVPHEVVPRLIADPVVRAVTLTGSERAGAAVGAEAGRHLKKAVLELGGSDAFVVCDDVDVPAVAREAVKARVQNAGQTCIAAKRFLVPERIADAFVDRMRAEMEALVVGDPMERKTDLGPLARADLREALEKQIERTLAAGAKLVTGGTRVGDRGFFFAPTLLDEVRPGMVAADEETFGPLAAVIRVRDEEEAIAIANASRFGLGGSVWSASAERAEALAVRLEAGSVFANGIVKSDPRLPFGGVKRSGFGRELSGYGLCEFVNVKTVWVGDPAS